MNYVTASMAIHLDGNPDRTPHATHHVNDDGTHQWINLDGTSTTAIGMTFHYRYDAQLVALLTEIARAAGLLADGPLTLTMPQPRATADDTHDPRARRLRELPGHTR